MQRLATAAVLVPLVLAAVKLAPASVFFALTALFIAGACWECYRMLGVRGAPPLTWVGVPTAVGLAWTFYAGPTSSGGVAAILFAGSALSAILAIWLRKDPAAMLETTMKTLFPVLFVGLTLSHLVGLRQIPGDGEDLLLLLFVCVYLADTGAFYVGTLIGRHRLAPRLSPKKSWEGAVGGLVASVGGALIAHAWFFQRLPVSHAVALGLLLGMAGVMGDLTESMVKRAAGVKDSSSLLPGHGGLLDRTDSLLLAGPILYYYYVTIPW